MHIVFFVTIILITVLALTHWYFFDYNQLFFESIFAGLIGNVIFLFVTIFILDRLIKRHYEKSNEIADKKKYLDILTNRHEILVSSLTRRFVHLTNAEPVVLIPENNDLEWIVNNLEDYINTDYLSRQYKINVVEPNNVFLHKDVSMSYQKFFKYHFKDEITNSFKDYISRYVSFIPNDVLESIFKIEDTLKDNIFTVPEDHDANLDISNAHFNPEDFIVKLRLIGLEIMKLRNYSK